MSIAVSFYKFAKRRNSTLTPTVTSDWQAAMDIKSPTSVTRPVLELRSAGAMAASEIWQYNYCYIPTFARYYYCAWSYIGARWQSSLEVDVLATYKAAIGNYTGYVQRSSYASDGNVIDRQYPTLSGAVHRTKVIPLNWQDEISLGRYVVGVIAPGPGSTGSVSYYVMYDAEFRAFCNAIFNNSNDWLNSASITDISTDLLKVLFNPFEYIVSCMWFPTIPPAYTTSASTPLGWWSIPVSSAVLAADSQITYTYTVTPDAHPQAATRGAYLNGAPYTELELDFQPFGHVTLPADKIRGRPVQMRVTIDYISGGACLRLLVPETATGAGDGVIYASIPTQLGVPIQLSGREHSILSGVSGLVSQAIPAAAGAISDAGWLGADVAAWASPVVDLLSGVADAISTGTARLTSTGSNGNRAQLLSDAYLAETYWQLVPEDNAEFGRPLLQVRQISTLSGYVKMSTADLALDCTEEERLAVQTAMLSGFYYE